MRNMLLKLSLKMRVCLFGWFGWFQCYKDSIEFRYLGSFSEILVLMLGLYMRDPTMVPTI